MSRYVETLIVMKSGKWITRSEGVVFVYAMICSLKDVAAGVHEC